MIETVTIDGLTVAVARPPAGVVGTRGQAPRPPLLLVHGILGGAWYWANYQRFFAERGYTSYAVNLRGHHGSRPVADLGRVSVMNYVEDALAVARSLGEPPVVIGHSMGGLIAQKLAEAGAVRAAVLINSAPPRGIVLTGWALLRHQIKYAVPILLSRPVVVRRADNDALTLNRVPPEQRAALHARFVPESGRAARELSIGAIAVDAGRVRCPVLSTSAVDDRFVGPAFGLRIAQKYHAPYRLFKEHAHFMLCEPGWDGPAAEIERWISHTVAREARPAGTDEALWARLKAHIGDEVTLGFYDGRRVRAELVSVDLAVAKDLIFEVVEVLDAGAAVTVPPSAGETTSAALSEIVEVDFDAARSVTV